MHAQQHVVVVRCGVDDAVSRARQRRLDPGGALGQLGARRADPDPDLGAGDVEQAVVAADDEGAGHPRSMANDGAVRATSVACRRESPSRAGPSLRQDARMATTADLGVRIGSLPTGPTNSVVDVPGVGLGHATVVYDDPPPPFGRGVARTGVTVIDLGGDAWQRPVPAGVALLNGAGELTARSQIDEWGLLETPVFLTSTMQVGRVYDAACRLLMAEQPLIGVDDVIIPAVGECDDSWLNDPRHMHVTDEHVAAALAAARVLGRLGQGARPGCGGCRNRDVVLQLQGRGRLVVARPARRPRGRRRAAHQLRPVGPAHDRRRRRGSRARRAGPSDAPARGLVPRGRRDRRAARPQRLRAARAAGGSRPRARRLHGAPRVRRDLPGGRPRDARRHAGS